MKDMGLGYRISLWLLALGVLGLVAAAGYVYMLRGELQSEALDRRAVELGNSLNNRLETKFDVGVTNAVTVARDPLLIEAMRYNDKELAKEVVDSVRKGYGDYTNYQGIHVHLFDRQGRAFFDSASRPAASDAASQGGVRIVLRERRTHAAFERDANGNVLIRAFAPLVHNDEVIGVAELTQGVGSISRDFAGEDVRYLMLLDRSHLRSEHPASSFTRVGDYVVANPRWFTDEVVDFAQAVNLSAALEQGRILDNRWFATVLPIEDEGGRVLALHVLGLPADVLQRDIAAATSLADSLLFAMVILVVLLVGLAMLLIRQMVIRPIGEIADALTDIAEGEGDLTHRLQVQRHDEIGKVATSFNRFTGNIQKLVQQLAEQEGQVANAGNQLGESTERTREGADRQQHEIVQIAAAIEEMGAAASEVAQNAHHTRESTEEGGDQVASAREAMDRLLKAIESQTSGIERTADDITALEKQSESIGEVVQVIREITEQTNLLALNAAIEAARAGEHGRGFAVVADEVRTLARRTHESTGTIEETVASLQERTRAGVSSMQENREKALQSLQYVRDTHAMLTSLAEMMERIRDMTTQIATATEEETAATAELSRSINRIQSIAEEAAANAEESARSAEHLLGLSDSMQKSVSRFRF